MVPAPNGFRGNVRYTRYQHSIGVAWLAAVYCSKLNLDTVHRRLICTAALLHDVGHAPLSHSLEPVFKEAFGLDHHLAAKQILMGQIELGREIHLLLRANNVDVDRVVAIMFGEEEACSGFFGGPINFDTIEGILRAEAYARRRPHIAGPEIVLDAAMRRASDNDRIVVDEFWMQKDRIYRHLINSRRGVLADFACQLFMRRNINKLEPGDYFTTESLIFRKLPGLRQFLTRRSFESDIMLLLDRPIDFKVRRFYIDLSGDFFKRQDTIRYRQNKVDFILRPERAGPEAPAEVEQELFDDDGYRSGKGAFRTRA